MNRIALLGAVICAAGMAAPVQGKPHRPNCPTVDLGVRAAEDAFRLGAAGIAACDSALAFVSAPEDEAPVRANIIRARALHRLAIGDNPGALADLDLAEQANPSSDILWRRSFVAANAMLRAYSYARMGDDARALEQSRAAAAARPFDMDLALAAARLDYSVTHDSDAYVARLREQARYDPGRIITLFAMAMVRGRYAEAIDLHSQILLTTPEGRGGYSVVGRQDVTVENWITRAKLSGALAYAFAATGQGRRAVAELDSFKAAVEQETNRRMKSAGDSAKWQAYVRQREQLDAAMRAWRDLVALRLAPRRPETAQAVAAMAEASARDEPLATDLARAVRKVQPDSTIVTPEMLRLFEARDSERLRRLGEINLVDILVGLPRIEVDGALPKFDHGNDGTFQSEGGYMAREGPVAGSQTVKFSTTKGSSSVASELVTMRAAQMALEQNKHGFIVLARRLLARSTTIAYGGTFPTGYEAEIDVVFVDPGALPPDYAGYGWRVADADAAWAAQSAVYIEARAALRRQARPNETH